MNLLDLTYAGLARICSMSTCSVLLFKITVLLAVAWLIHSALVRANPRWQVLLWRGVVVGLALVAAWDIGLPNLEIRVPAPEAVSTVTSPPLPAAVGENSPVDLPRTTVLPAEVAAPVEMPAGASQALADTGRDAAPVPDTTEASVSWQAILLSVWGCGVVLLLVRLAIGHLRLARLLPPASQGAPEWVHAEVKRIAAEISCRRAVQVRSSRRFSMPFLYGSRVPVLVLPERMCQTDYRSQLPGILAHELAHVRSRDFGWNVLLQTASIVLWFHPLAWRMGLAHRDACDGVCDAVSASYLGDVQGYCQTLARVALEGSAAFPVAGLAMARRCDVRRRVAVLRRAVFAMPLRRRSVIGVGLAALLSVAVLGSLQFALAESQPEETVAVASETEAAANKESTPDTAKPGAATEEKPTFKLTILDSEGKPVPQAKVYHSRVDRDKKRTYYSRTADEQGVVVLDSTAPENIGWFSFSVKTPGYAPFYGTWDNWNSEDLPPKEFTVRLKEGKTVGGVVTNEEGEPVKDVKVSFSFPYGADGTRHNDLTHCAASGTTDADGRWTCRYVPLTLGGRLQFTLNHPDYKTCQFQIALNELLADDTGKFAYSMVIRKGKTMSGTVEDAAGRPLVDADVFIEFEGMNGSEEDCMRRTKTDKDGKYRFENCPLGSAIIAAHSRGLAIQAQSCEIGKESEPVKLTMKPGKPLLLRVVDREGSPIENAYFYIRSWRGIRWINAKLLPRDDSRTGTDGRFDWKDAPQDEMEIEVYATDYMTSEAMPVRASDEVHVFKLYPQLDISGTVTDSVSGKPIPKFKVTPGIFFSNMPDNVRWEPRKARDHQDGKYTVRQKYPYAGYAVRIEAEGYVPEVSRKIEVSEGAVTLDFALKKADEKYLSEQKKLNRPRPRGVVLTPEGKPAAGATLGFANAAMSAYIQSGVLSEQSHRFFTHADSQGKFTVPPLKPKDAFRAARANIPDAAEEQPYAMVVLHDSGFAYLDYDEIKRRTKKDATSFDSPIQLQKWARVEGRLMLGDKPAAECPVNLQVEGPVSEDQSRPRRQSRIWYDYKTTTNHEGDFVFDSVPPGMTGTVARTIDFAQDGGSTSCVSSHAAEVVFEAGKTTTVQIGGEGRPVTGQLRYADGFPSKVDWKFALVRMKRGIPPAPPQASPGVPAAVQAAQKRILKEYADYDKVRELRQIPNWQQTEEGKEYMRRSKEFSKFSEEWKTTEEGKAYTEQMEALRLAMNDWQAMRSEAQRHQRCSAVDSKGRFRVEDVPQGEWVLTVEINNPQHRSDHSAPYELLNQEFPMTLLKAPAGRDREPFDTGVLTLSQAGE